MKSIRSHGVGAGVVVAVALGALLANSAAAGTLCGKVHDTATGAPVDRAGIFVRTTAGAYTGMYGATNAAGNFCIAAVPAGTYDLEVRVDDYRVGWMRNVVVTGTSTDVDLRADPVPVRFAPPAPNPARRSVTFRWTQAAEAATELVVTDFQGRLVRRWAGRVGAGSHETSWDLADVSGQSVRPGIYVVRLQSGLVRRAHRLTILP